MRLKLANIVSHALTAFVVLAVGTVLSAAAAYFMARQTEHDASLKFERVVAEAEEAIETRIRAYSDVLLGVRALFIASDSVTRDEFQTYIASLDLNRRYPGIQVIHYAQRVPAAQKRAFEAMVRNDRSVDPRGYPDFAVKPPGNRLEYFIVQYVEPMAGNEAALGLDLGGDAVRLATLERTRDSGQLTASGTIALALDPRRHPGFAMRLPVYRKGMPVATVAQRREAFTGMVSTSFVVIDLMRGVLSEQFLQTMHVRIHDAGFLDSPHGLQQPSAENLMFDSDRLRPAGSRRDISSGSKLANPPSTATLEVGGRRWNLHFSAREGLIAPSERLLPWATFLVGAVISLLLFGLIRSLATSGRRAIYLAERITQDLRKSEQQFQATFDQAAVGIAHFDLQNRNIKVNRRYSEIVGYTPDELLGKSPGFLNHLDDIGIGSEQRSQLHSGAIDHFSQDKRYLRKDGTVIWVRRTESLARDDAGAPQYYIRVIEDVTERKEADKRQAMEHAVTRVLAESTTFDEAMLAILQTICEGLGWACGAHWQWDENAELLRCVKTWHVDSVEVANFSAASRQDTNEAPRWDGGASKTKTGGLVRGVWFSGAPVWVPDVTQQPGFRRGPAAVKADLHCAFAFPILAGGQPLGVMEFYGRDIKKPDEVLLQIVLAIGSQIGQYIVRQQAEERVRHLAHYDELTRLPNRTMFYERLGHALTQARRSKRALSVLFIDLDRFKNINDTLGHEAGDSVLKEVANRLRDCLRDSDTVGRLGGDEFVVLIEEPPQPVNAAVVSQKILAAMGTPFLVQAQEFQISASIGISSYPDDGADMQTLMKNADIAMYRAKEQGKNNYQFYSTQINVHSIERLK